MMPALIVALAVQQIPIKLEFWPDLGTRVAYERTMSWNGEQGTSYEAVDRLEGRVSQRDSRGEVTTEWMMTPVRAAIDGTSIPSPAKSAISFKERRMRNGVIAYRQELPQDSYEWLRYAGVMNPIFPSEAVGPGSKWQMEWMEEQANGLPPCAISMRFVEWADPTEKTFVRCSIGFAEKNRTDAMKGHGQVVIDAKNGITRELVLNVESASVPGDEEREKMKLTITLKPLPVPAR